MKIFKSIGLIFAGVVSIVMSFVCFLLPTGTKEELKYFKGDAYTEIQHTTAKTTNNIAYLAKIVRTGFGSGLLVGGIALIMAGLPTDED